jgi:hypothetical protein
VGRWLPAAWAVLRRPSLWGVALAVVWRLAVPGWWRRPPFLPLPDRDYLRFRMSTAYGDPTAAPTPGDVVAYLHWCRAWPRIVG